MRVDVDLPVIREVRPWYQKWIGTRFSYPERHMRFITVPSARSAFEQRMSLAPRARRELLVFLNLRLKIVERAKGRSIGCVGRLYNVQSGEKPEYLRMSESELKDVLQVVGGEVDDLTEMDARYDLRVDVAREALKVLEQADVARG